MHSPPTACFVEDGISETVNGESSSPSNCKLQGLSILQGFSRSFDPVVVGHTVTYCLIFCIIGQECI